MSSSDTSPRPRRQGPSTKQAHEDRKDEVRGDDDDPLALLRELSLASERVFRLTDVERLGLAREMLDQFRDERFAWSDADGWPSRETTLVGKRGSVRGASALRLRMAFAVGNSLRSYARHLEHVVGERAGPPPLRRRAERYGDAVVYGPVDAGVLGGEFELWSRPTEIQEDSEVPATTPGVSVVLGAGNQSMVTVLDVLHRFFNARQPVLVKHHPLRPWLYDCYAVLLLPLARRGYVRQILDRGVPKTTRLLSHPLCAHVHVTGSLDTLRKVKRTLALSRPGLPPSRVDAMVTSELGGASPWIVVPGDYSPKELEHVSRSLVSSKKNFGGANCVAGQIIVLSKRWEGKRAFLDAVRHELRRQPDSVSYYPGARRRRRDLLSRYPLHRVEIVPSETPSTREHDDELSDDDRVALVHCGTPGEDGYVDAALVEEAFCAVLAVVELDHFSDDDDGTTDWLNDAAVPFVNDDANVFGSLACNLVAPNASAKGPSVRRAVADLRYGMVAVNEWIALAIMAAVNGGAWGPNGRAEGLSGRGFVGNPYRIPCLDKMVTYRDLRLPPAFDELTQPPLLVVNRLGFELACRPDNGVLLSWNFVVVILTTLWEWATERIAASTLFVRRRRTREREDTNDKEK